MERYKNRGGQSGVVGYEVDDTGIKVKFHDGNVYLYTAESAGAENLEKMKQLALGGSGLNSFINREVKKRYARKIQ